MSDSNQKQTSHDEYAQQYQDYYYDQQGSNNSYYDQQQQQQQQQHQQYYDQQGGNSSYYDQGDAYNEKSSNNGIHRMEDTIYISNLPQEVTEEKLASHFGSIGIIKTDKKLRKPKTTITYDDPPSADAAIDWFGGKEFMGNVIQVSKAERKMNVDKGSRGGRGGGRGYSSSGRNDRSAPNNSAREGDWTCEECGANNFSRRDGCFSCHKPRAGKRNDDRRNDSYRSNRNYRRDRPY
ncbi:hypothetical protein RO3G_08727 [Rhizopus delemar RA 99-880]|uniref:RanBP2-type domain-containing protein n=1 Tax=Rhizopus delemar (strain RA 99-880 / ATCC MYA-4621 / FGSC 9543 / NRRL 43880) TaxID=246409 RepID=I1C6E2_RHIO9|nr:hypothetical protein RO3G_08727 [Rhizopus delemar RA 99-880]|eukprot:EIE84022.1 hypothetical protein RO3G_08727 [Rhizopus delemar RA 99-880]